MFSPDARAVSIDDSDGLSKRFDPTVPPAGRTHPESEPDEQSAVQRTLSAVP
jgi:hypothetical protein